MSRDTLIRPLSPASGGTLRPGRGGHYWPAWEPSPTTNWTGRVSAAALRLGDLEPGSRVAIYLPKDERYVTLVLAVIRAGHVACPVSDRLPPRGVAQLLERAACAALISDDDELLRTAGAGLYAVEARASTRGAGSAGSRRTSPWSVPRPSSSPRGVQISRRRRSTPSAIITTTRSARTPTSCSGRGTGGSTRCRSITSGEFPSCSDVCSLAQRSRSPGTGPRSASSIAGLGATHVSLVSTQLLRLLREDTELAGLKAVLMGGGPVSASLVDEAVLRGLPIHTSYGLTEMASQVTTTPPGASLEALRTAGRVLPEREVSISEEGEILVRGETLFAGYVEGETIEPSVRHRRLVPYRGSRDLGRERLFARPGSPGQSLHLGRGEHPARGDRGGSFRSSWRRGGRGGARGRSRVRPKARGLRQNRGWRARRSRSEATGVLVRIQDPHSLPPVARRCTTRHKARPQRPARTSTTIARPKVIPSSDEHQRHKNRHRPRLQ